MNLDWASAKATRDAVVGGATSAEAVCRAALDRARLANGNINAVVEMLDESALEQARQTDRALAERRPVGPLAGVPVVLKDNICWTSGRTTCGSRMLEQYRSPFAATAAARLAAAGASIIAKSNLDEFAMGSSTEHSIHGPTRNPWDTTRVPGGSSGGSAAAVASGIVPVALGSDTGGSIRQPAGLCNLVGYKPTYGHVSRYGLVAYASSLDQIGPFARTVEDAALIASVISGHDPLDATSLPGQRADLLSHLDEPVNRLIVGVPREARSEANHPSVTKALEASAAALASQGATIVDVDLPLTDKAIAAYYIIAAAEASSNLARFDGVRYGRRAQLGPGEGLVELYAKSRAEGFGPEVQRRIMLGTHVLSAGYADAYYVTALKVRRLIRQEYERAFTEGGASSSGPGMGCQVLLMPSSPGPAFAIGSKTSDPLAMYLEDVYTVGVNLAGLPAITVPGGFAREGETDLPVGVQFVGRADDDATLLRVARMLEQATQFGLRRPSV